MIWRGDDVVGMQGRPYGRCDGRKLKSIEATVEGGVRSLERDDLRLHDVETTVECRDLCREVGTGISLWTFWPGCAGSSGISGISLGSLDALRPCWTLWSFRSVRAVNPVRSGWTSGSGWTRGSR